MRVSSRRFLLLLLVAVFYTGAASLSVSRFPSPAYGQRPDNVFTGHVVAVTAGDTMDVRVGDDWTVTVRLHGVECPTSPRALRETATRYTSRLLLDTDVRVEVRGTASRSVVYGEVFPGTGGESVNFLLARDGVAKWASEYAAQRTDLANAEEFARNARRGLWGAEDGSNISLPASAADSLRRKAAAKAAVEAARAKAAAIKVGASAAVRAQSPTPAPTKAPTPQPAPPRPATPKPAPVAAPVRVAATPTPKAIPARDPGTARVAPFPASLVGGFSVGVLAFLSLLAYGVACGLPFAPRRLFCQLCLALLAGGLGAMLFAFPLAGWQAKLAVGQEIPATLILALVGPALAALLLRVGIGIIGAAARLRSAAVDPRSAMPGSVKLYGTAQSATGELVRSEVGRIKGLYVREVTSRYTAETATGKRLSSPRWVEMRDVAGAVDLEIFSSAGDGTGSALVLAAQDEETPPSLARAHWVPYHVARFYNEVPSDAWFATAYEGDTRTEVFFVPSGATLTVWGNLHPPAPASTEKMLLPVPQITPGGETGTLLICDGPEARAYSGRGVVSLPFGIGWLSIGVLCAVGGVWGVGTGGELAQQSALASLAAGMVVVVYLAIRRGAVLSRSAVREEREGETDPLRRPARAIWEGYRASFPGVLIAPVMSD